MCEQKLDKDIENLLVSICIPTYNGEEYLEEALASIKAQTYKNIEVIVSDDDSKDNTLKLVKLFKNQVNYPVTIINHKPKGIGANWNSCIKNANGKFIKFLFQDDILLPTSIEEMVTVFNQKPALGLVACKREFIIEGKPSEEITKWISRYENLQSQFEKYNKLIIIDNSIFARHDFQQSPMNKIGEPSTVMFRKAIVEDVGYFDENLRQILDYVFYYRILKKYSIGIINKPLVKFRIHDKQATNINRNTFINDYDIYKKILYKEFLPLLHQENRKALILKFSKFAKLKKKLKSVARRIFR